MVGVPTGVPVRQTFCDWSVPIAGVANVCLPASWAGPKPLRKPVKCLSVASLTPGKIKLKGKWQHERNLLEGHDAVTGTTRTRRASGPRRRDRGLVVG